MNGPCGAFIIDFPGVMIVLEEMSGIITILHNGSFSLYELVLQLILSIH